MAWHDPLVQEWKESQSVDLTWDCDLAILAIKQHGLDIAMLLSRGVPILDCTNSILNTIGVSSL